MKKISSVWKTLVSTLLLVTLLVGMTACSMESSAPKAQPAENVQAPEQAADESDGGEVELKGKRVAFFSPANQFDFFVYIGAKVKQVAEEYGIEVDIFDASTDVTKQTDQVTQAILQKYDAIILAPVDGQALESTVEEALEAGVPVINYDSRIDIDGISAHIGSSNVEMGNAAAEYTAEYLKEKNGDYKGHIVAITFPSLTTVNDRVTGFTEYLSQYPDIVVEERTVEHATAESSQQLIDNVLVATERDTLDMIYGPNAGMVLGAYASVTSAGRDDVAIVGIDNEEGQLTALQDNANLKATIAQDSIQIGEQAMLAAIAAMQGEDMGDVVISSVPVTIDNVDQYLEDQLAQQAELEADQ